VALRLQCVIVGTAQLASPALLGTPSQLVDGAVQHDPAAVDDGDLVARLLDLVE
jgi:hypothetical protein